MEIIWENFEIKLLGNFRGIFKKISKNFWENFERNIEKIFRKISKKLFSFRMFFQPCTVTKLEAQARFDFHGVNCVSWKSAGL